MINDPLTRNIEIIQTQGDIIGFSFVSSIFIIFVAFVITKLLKNRKTIISIIISIFTSIGLLIVLYFILLDYSQEKIIDIVDKKVEKMCFTPIENVKATISKESLRTRTGYELADLEIKYLSKADRILTKHARENIKKTEELKPTWQMNMQYTILLKNMEEVTKERLYRHKYCLKNMCNEAYYSNDYYYYISPIDYSMVSVDEKLQKIKNYICKGD